MTSPVVPIGKPESSVLEYKRRDALKEPGTIGRAVVAMLNAEGGEVWVGVVEAGGILIAFEGIDDPDWDPDRLWNHLVDTIEPPPRHSEIQFSVFKDDDGQKRVLCIVIKPEKSRRPYAWLSRGGRHFVVRSGPRTRYMTREEILERAVPKSTADGGKLQAALRAILEKRDSLQRTSQQLFWLRLQPSLELEFDIQSPEMSAYLRDPTLSGNRRSGWTFSRRFNTPILSQGKLQLGEPRSSWIELHRSGAINYQAPLLMFWHDNPHENERLIYPFALLERTASVFRLGSTLYRTTQVHQAGDGFQVGADLAMFSAKGWRLRPGSPKASDYVFGEFEKTLDTQDLVLERPFVFDSAEIIDEPDRCAFRVLSRIYEAFGFSEEMIPKEFDRKTGRLVLGE